MAEMYECLNPFVFTGALAIPVVLVVIHLIVIGRRGKHLATLPRRVSFFGPGERVLHFLRMFAFVAAAATGLVFVYIGNTQALGMTHGISGILYLIVSLITLAVWAKDSRLTGDDQIWLRQWGGYLSKKHVSIPSGKFNAGQKILFWLTGLLSIIMGVTGAILLANLHSAAPWYRAVVAWHGVTSALLIALIIGHFYLAVIANPGTWRVLIDGKVAKEWAEYHHPNWKQE